MKIPEDSEYFSSDDEDLFRASSSSSGDEHILHDKKDALPATSSKYSYKIIENQRQNNFNDISKNQQNFEKKKKKE